MKWNVVGWDGPTLNTWEVEADHASPGSAWLSFTRGNDPRTTGVDELPPNEVARFVTENVFCFYAVEGNSGLVLPPHVKRLD